MGRYIDVSPKARMVTQENCHGDDRFAGAYYRALSEAREQTKGDAPRPQTSHSRSNAEIAQMLNRRYAKMRGIIDVQMLDYLARNRGRIDSWPTPVDEDDMWQYRCGKSGDMQESLLYFDYFGRDYTAAGPRIVRAGEEPEYHDTYQCPNTREYDELNARLEQLDRQAKSGASRRKIRMGAVRTILALVGLALLAFIVILQSGGGAMLEGWLKYVNGAAGRDFNSLVNVLTVIVSIPAWAALNLAFMLRDFSSVLCKSAWVLPGAAMILCLLPALRTYRRRSRQKKSLRVCDAARAAADALRASDEYRDVVRRNDEFRKERNGMSEEWHRAWYDCCLALREGASAE